MIYRPFSIFLKYALVLLIALLSVLFLDARHVCAASSLNTSKYASMLSSSPGNKAFDVRARAGLSSTSFRVMEGACTDGTYGYFALLNNQSGTCKIIKVSLASIAKSPAKAVVKVSDELYLGHANDMCFNTVGKEIYVIHNVDGKDSSRKISIVNPASLKLSRTITLQIPESLKGATSSQLASITGLCGISYLPSRNEFVIMLSGIYGNFLVLDGNFTPIRFVKCQKRSPYINQGIDCDEDSIFVGRSSGSGSHYKNIIEEYTWDGKYVRQIDLKGLTYEIESLYHIDDQLYLSCYAYNGLIAPYVFGFLYNITDVAAVTGVRAGNPSLVIRSGSSASLDASVTPVNASVQSLMYMSSNNRVASVSSSGICRGLTPGDATILICSNQGLYTTTANVTVVGVPKITQINNQTSGILLQWVRQSSYTRVAIWRKSGKKAGARFKKIASVQGTNSFIDKRAKPGRFYTYKLVSQNGRVISAYSPVRSMWRLKTPKIKDVSSPEPGTLNVTWKKVKGASYYHIVYSKKADFKKARAVNVKGEENRQILIDKGLRKKQVYYLKVYACHKGGKRVFSQPSAVFKKKTK